MKTHANQSISRRQCLRNILMLGASLLAGTAPLKAKASEVTKVVIVKTNDRAEGIRAALSHMHLSRFQAKSVALKANYNSADPFPASTHPSTLETIIAQLQEAGCGPMTLAERSGMGDTPYVLETMGAEDICKQRGVKTVVMDDLGADGYVLHRPSKSNWKNGFLLAKAFDEADMVVQTCCLKTHQYGGHFTLALKNAVGAVAKHDPKTGYNYMSELHRSPLQRTLIPEISLAFRNDLIVLDGMKAFVTGGPHSGREVEPGVIITGTDPVAVDAVGVAILRMFGTTSEVSRGKVFDQEQIKRGAELGVGVNSPDQIELVGVGDGGAEFAEKVRSLLG